jgi:hypothetical protein
MGYGLVDLFEFGEYSATCLDKGTKSGDLLAEYVDTFQKLKQESSGYPSWDQSDEDKYRYIEDYRRPEGIASDNASFSKIDVQRTLAKIKKTMWGKWAQNQNKTQTNIFISENEFYKLLTSLGTEVTNLIFTNNEVA